MRRSNEHAHAHGADSAAIIQALDGGSVTGMRTLIRRAVPGAADSIDDLARLTVAVRRHIEHGTVQLKPRGQSVQIALTSKGKRRARLMRRKPIRQRYAGLGSYGPFAAAAAAAVIAGCSTPQPERPRAHLMGFPIPVGVQQVRGADGQDYFEPCNPCAAPTLKTRVAGGYFEPDYQAGRSAEPGSRLALSVLPTMEPGRVIAQAQPRADAAAPGQPAASAKARQAAIASSPRKLAVFFGYGQSRLTSEGRQALVDFAAQSKDAPVIHIRGSTDSQGDATANEILAKNRAAVVRAELIAQGVPRARIKTTYCTRCYVDKNDTAEGRRANRRVDLSVDPLSSN